jgi:protein-S-isoprenylcysteine O-methyltransferase Ste14
MWALARAVPQAQWSSGSVWVTGAALAAALGGGVALAGVLAFRRAHHRQPAAPQRASALTSDIYRVTRNPCTWAC